MNRYTVEREVVIIEVTDVEANSEDEALKEVASWPKTDTGWDRVDWEYGRPYIADSELIDG